MVVGGGVTEVSPLAAVAMGARLGAGVKVGPFCVVGAEVSLGEGTRVLAGAVVTGRTTIGRGCVLHAHCVVGTEAVRGETVLGDFNTVFPGAVVGVECQDLKYDRGGSEMCRLEVGDGNAIREYCTVHLSSRPEWTTRIGDGNLLMAYTHVAHDCQVGDANVLANGTQLAGHVVVGDRVHTGGGAMVHQFCHVGSMSFLAPGAKVVADVPYGAMVHGDRAALRGLNEVGMQRAGMGRADIAAMRRAFRYLFPKLPHDSSSHSGTNNKGGGGGKSSEEVAEEEGGGGTNREGAEEEEEEEKGEEDDEASLDGRLARLLRGDVLDAAGGRLVSCAPVREFATFIRDSRAGAAVGARRDICMPRPPSARGR